MKKRGVINAALAGQLAALGHYDRFVICDMGFPVPKGATVIDLALVEGVPDLARTVKAVCSEVAVERLVLMDSVATANPALDARVRDVFRRQTLEFKPFEDLRAMADDAKFVIRTGEAAPCSNILFVSASGAPSRVARYDIPAEELERFTQP